jgi:hypothetical protein
MLLPVHWPGLETGGLAALWLQYGHHQMDWWVYLIIIGISILSAIFRGNRYGGRYGNGAGVSFWFGNTDQTWRGGNLYTNQLLPPVRLTPPPMPDPAQAAVERYQQTLDAWMLQHGMSPQNPDHVRLALEANPYTPAAAPAAAGSALPATPPQQVQELLWLYDKPWWVAGGWALDLWLGHQSREHKDLEIAIARADQFALRGFMSQFRFVQVVAVDGARQAAPLPTGEWVQPPAHELHAQRVTGAGTEALPLLQLEVLLNEIEDGVWRYRRDQRVSLPLERLGGTSQDGVPYLVPEVVLLYKAGLWHDGVPVSAQDDADFRQALPLLSPAAQYWLREAIATAHPGHPWLLVLGGTVYGN